MDNLPEIASRKITMLKLRFADAEALQNSGRESIGKLRQREQYHQSALDRLKSGGTYANTAADIATEEAALKAIRQEIETVNGLIVARSARVQNDGDVIRAIERWLAKAGATPFRAVAAPAQDLGNIALTEALESARSTIAWIKNELRRIRGASLPASDLKKAAEAYVNGLAKSRRPTIRNRHSSNEIEFNLLPSEFAHDTSAVFNRSGVLSLLAWLDPQRLLERLEAEIDSTTDTTMTVSAEEKQRAEIELPAELLAWERTEEALVEMAIDNGLDVTRRPDASPLAILGIERDEGDIAAAA